MSEIVIRRCTFRVTRRGGWCWGEDRRAIAERMTGLVPGLVAEKLAELFGDSPADQQVSAPMRLDVRINRGDLRDPLALNEAVRRALGKWQLPAEVSADVAVAKAHPGIPSAVEGIASGTSAPVGAVALAGSPVLRLLLGWREEGTVSMNIAALPESVAAAWLARLAAAAPVDIGNAVPAADFERHAEALVARLLPALAAPEAAKRASLFLAAECLFAFGSLPPPGTLMARLETAMARSHFAYASGKPKEGAAGGDPPTSSDRAPVPEGAAGAVPSLRDLPKAARWKEGATEVQLASVLPFLTLGMLHKIGWLDLAGAAVEGIGGGEDGAFLAAALAERLITPAVHRRAGYDAARRTGAFFAGLGSVPSRSALASWGERHADHLVPTEHFVARTIADGHDPLQPLMILRAGPDGGAENTAPFVLVDSDGGYPLAVVQSPAQCVQVLSRFRASPLLVARDAATPELLAALHAGDLSWITDAPPGRGEAGERMPGLGALWTAGDIPPARMRSAASGFPVMEPLARECCARLLQGTRPLDRAAFLATGMGLGLLAWSLWHKSESVHPLLALERLSDLDGVALIDADTIEIRPAIGRRYLDLRDAGALAAIPAVPWLGGRSVRFSGP